jgi:peroxiredoxin
MLPIDQPAPDFELCDLDRNLHTLRDYRSQITVLNFWSAECPHATRVDAGLLAFLPVWGERVALLAIASNANEPPALLKQTASQRGLPTVLLDTQNTVADRYRAVTTPHLFVIDEQGILRYQGALDDVTFRQRTPTRPYLIEAVQSLLDGKHPDPAETPPYGCAIVRYAL